MGWSKLSVTGATLFITLSACVSCWPGDARGGATTPNKQSPQGTPHPSDRDHSVTSAPSRTLSTSFRKLFEGPGAFLVHEGELYIHTEEFFFNATKSALLTRCSFATGHWESGQKLYWLARMSPYSACPDDPILMTHESGKLLPRRHIDAHDLHITSYRDQDIALVVPHRAGPPWGYELISLNGGASPPKPRQATFRKSAEESAHCYTELQNPFALFGFESEHLFVFGGFLCPKKHGKREGEGHPEDQPPEEDTSLTEESLQSVSAEYWLPGVARSKLVSFGFDETLAIAALRSDALWILGQKTADSRGTTQSLFHFDGHTWSELTLPSAEKVLSIEATTNEQKEPELWLLQQSQLVRARDGHFLRLPGECKTPLRFQIHEQAVWLSCEEGVFGTDEQVEVRLTLPEDASCPLLDVRPEQQTPPLWGKGTSTGCGARSKEHDREFLFPAEVTPDDF